MTHPFGKDIAGTLIYTSSGYFSALVMRKNRTLFESEDQMNGSIEEIMENFRGAVSYFGRYAVENNVVTHHVEESLFPNWKYLAMKSFAKLANNLLEQATEPTTWQGENFVGVLVWKRWNISVSEIL